MVLRTGASQQRKGSDKARRHAAPGRAGGTRPRASVPPPCQPGRECARRARRDGPKSSPSRPAHSLEVRLAVLAHRRRASRLRGCGHASHAWPLRRRLHPSCPASITHATRGTAELRRAAQLRVARQPCQSLHCAEGVRAETVTAPAGCTACSRFTLSDVDDADDSVRRTTSESNSTLRPWTRLCHNGRRAGWRHQQAAAGRDAGAGDCEPRSQGCAPGSARAARGTQVSRSAPLSLPREGTALLGRRLCCALSLGLIPSNAPRTRASAAKTARLRQAQEEATAEVATYRASREDGYRKIVSGVRPPRHLPPHPTPPPAQPLTAARAHSKLGTRAPPASGWRRRACAASRACTQLCPHRRRRWLTCWWATSRR